MSASGIESANAEDVFKILIATDIHLGYGENNPVRADDSFITFEEILQLAKNNDVDFILLGGDLFHDNKPSTDTLNRCISLLRRYCMGDRPIAVEFVSDQAENFKHCSKPNVNYDDPDLNISIPVFSIHGNHDDPSGNRQVSALDILGNTGLVNYFGKWTDITEVNILPILLRKGVTKLALYGLSYIKDERLSRLFRDKKVAFYRAKEDTDSWFNIFVCHQNRSDHGIHKYLPAEALPDLIDLVFWGHEHECRIDFEYTANRHFSITQPGSSVVTSLCEGESKQKHVGLLRIWKKEARLRPLPLRTVRPFVFESISLSECNIPRIDNNTSDVVQDYLREKIESYIDQSREQLTGHPKQPAKPLIRLKVEYEDEAQYFNPIRFGQQFQAQVANPTDIVIIRKAKSSKKKQDGSDFNKDAMEQLLQQSDEINGSWDITIKSVMKDYFTEHAKALRILSLDQMSEATSAFIEKQEKEAIHDLINEQIKKEEQRLMTSSTDVDDIEATVNQLSLKAHLDGDAGMKRSNNFPGSDEDNLFSSDDDDEVKTSRGRGRGRVRGSTRGSTSARSRGQKKPRIL